MKDLVALFERAGCVDVRHYIQSGNVVFGAKTELGTRIGGLVAQAIERNHGLKVPVVVRSAAEMRAVVGGNPYLSAGGVDGKKLHVMFLAEKPSKERAATLDPGRSPGDAFVLSDRDVYLCLPNGVAKTRLTNAYFDAALRTTSTIRNWSTVLELAKMAGALATVGV